MPLATVAGSVAALLVEADTRLADADAVGGAACVERALVVAPAHAGALRRRGESLRSQGRLQEAVQCLEAAAAGAGEEGGEEAAATAAALVALGSCLGAACDAEAALACFRRAAALPPGSAAASYRLGVAHAERGEGELALASLERSVELQPEPARCHEARLAVGTLHRVAGRFEQAIAAYGAALAARPGSGSARCLMAVALTDQGTALKAADPKAGIRCYKRALLFNSYYPEAYYNLGVAYSEVGKREKAIVNYQLAIHFNPQSCEACNNLGVAYREMDQMEMSARWYEAAVAINPTFAHALSNLGVIATIQCDFRKAQGYLERAIRADPSYSDAHNNIGVLLRDLGDMAGSLRAYEACLRLCTGNRNAAHNKLLALNYLDARPQHYEEHVSWGNAFAKQAAAECGYLSDRPGRALWAVPKPRAPLSFNNAVTADRPLVVGYISPDFFTHSVSYFIEAALANHDPAKVKVVCYSSTAVADAKTERFKQMAVLWRRIEALSSDEAAEVVRSDAVDILVDLAGHTAGNRLDVLALRAAPVQVSWIGYPNTYNIRIPATNSVSTPCC